MNSNYYLYYYTKGNIVTTDFFDKCAYNMSKDDFRKWRYLPITSSDVLNKYINSNISDADWKNSLTFDELMCNKDKHHCVLPVKINKCFYSYEAYVLSDMLFSQKHIQSSIGINRTLIKNKIIKISNIKDKIRKESNKKLNILNNIELYTEENKYLCLLDEQKKYKANLRAINSKIHEFCKNNKGIYDIAINIMNIKRSLNDD